MAKKKTAEDLVWDNIFSNIVFENEPPAKYIKDAVIRTKTGKRIKLSGPEFVEVMEYERNIDPEQAVIESCRVNLDFDKLKTDVDKFAISILRKASRKYRKSKLQTSQALKLAKLKTATAKKPTN